jgi:GGDEF domain-containing protein
MTDTSPTDAPIRSKIADESSIETVEIGQHCGGHLLAGLQDSASEKVKSLHQQTTTDVLTGVSNRSPFNTVIEDLTAKSSKGGPSFSLVICDIDHFKRGLERVA